MRSRKTFRQPSGNQEIVLSTAEELLWPSWFDDPLPRRAGLSSKVRLHVTIKALNRYQKPHLVQFKGDGTGTRVGWEYRMGKDAGRPLAEAAAALVDYMLFVDEATLPGPIAGPTPFAKTFSSKGPRDAKGRSFRDFQLMDRLMRYPCSYLIYSPEFDALPATAKAVIYDRLWEVLSDGDPSPRYDRLTPADRHGIVEILRATKTDLPDYFYPAPSGS